MGANRFYPSGIIPALTLDTETSAMSNLCVRHFAESTQLYTSPRSLEIQPVHAILHMPEKSIWWRRSISCKNVEHEQ